MDILVILNLIVPFVMILIGNILKKHPQMDMTSHNGYNTPRSRKSQKHWDYAQSIAPDVFIWFGSILIGIEVIVSFLLLLLKVNISIVISIGMGIGFVFLLIAFLRVEELIKNKLD